MTRHPQWIQSAALGLCCLSAAVAAQTGITLLGPDGGETFHIGDTIHIRWTADTTVPQVVVQVSLDGGDRWIGLFASGVSQGSPGWGDTTWVVPATIIRPPADTLSTLSSTCLITVFQYGDRSIIDQSAAFFAIAVESDPDDGGDDGCGCGSGAGAAFIPPLCFKVGRMMRKRRQRPLS